MSFIKAFLINANTVSSIAMPNYTAATFKPTSCTATATSAIIQLLLLLIM